MGRDLARTWVLATGIEVQCCIKHLMQRITHAADPSAAGLSPGPGDCDYIRTLSTGIKKLDQARRMTECILLTSASEMLGEMRQMRTRRCGRHP